jgi:hypothetical protein
VNLLSAAAAYLLGHFIFYVAVLRRLRRLQKEFWIFLYHAWSAVGLLVSLLVVSAPAVAIAGCLSLHGIYSLSFLELWSLSEGGYSLAILRRVQAASGGAISQESLAPIGSAKKSRRIASLMRLGLVARSGSTIRLTPGGRAVAAGLRLLVAVARLTEVG